MTASGKIGPFGGNQQQFRQPGPLFRRHRQQNLGGAADIAVSDRSHQTGLGGSML